MLPRPVFQLDGRPAEQRRYRVGRHRTVVHASVEGLPRPLEHARGIVRLNVARHDHLARGDTGREVVRRHDEGTNRAVRCPAQHSDR
jgi:hypothetical protein